MKTKVDFTISHTDREVNQWNGASLNDLFNELIIFYGETFFFKRRKEETSPGN
jgi:hypothetical protein